MGTTISQLPAAGALTANELLYVVQGGADRRATVAQVLAPHAARTDNPHNVTAAQVNAYTKAEVDALVQAAQGLNIPGLPAAGTVAGNELTILVQGGVTVRGTVDDMLRIGTRVAAASHAHALADVVGLQAALDGKANLSHAHAIGDVTGLIVALNGKADTTHSHAIAEVAGLQAALNGKANTVHSHSLADLGGVQAALDAKANLSHSHAIADVSGLQAALDGKAATAHAHAIADVTGLAAALAGKASTGAIGTSGLTSPSGVLLGRFAAGTGDVQAITIGAGLALDGSGVLTASGGGGGGGAVSSVAGLTGAISAAALKGALAIVWGDVGGKPTFATVATSGAYSDLSGRPSLGTAAGRDVGTIAGTVAAGDDPRLSDARTPTTHTHTAAQITDGATVFAAAAHTHAIAGVTGLQTALDGKSNVGHGHGAFSGATAGAGGSAGFVPAPAAGDQGRFLRGDGTWAVGGGAQTSGGNTWSGTQVYGGATLDGPQFKAHRFLSANKGTVSSGTVTFTVSDAPHQRLQCGGALTLAFTGWAPAGSFSDMMLELVNGGGVNLSWPVAINWIKADGTTTTSFGSNGVTLTSGTTNRDWVYLWTVDGGTTIFGKIVR